MLLTDPSRVLVRRAVAMASEIALNVVAGNEAGVLLDDAIAVFHDVDRTCTRFDPASDLMRANRDGNRWVRVHAYCFEALVEAYAAYRRTSGRFDPRVLSDLERLGYDVSYTKRPPSVADPRAALQGRDQPRTPWAPRFRGDSSDVQVGPEPVDLGGIGKGLALRWAAALLKRHGLTRFLLDAGGDVVCGGMPSDGTRWCVAIEDPLGTDAAVAVLELCDEAVATSSIRLRRWDVGGTPVHHLIDPGTGLPGGTGLSSVTVVDTDAAAAEVWSKVLFLSGERAIAATAQFFQIPCVWVTNDGVVGSSAAVGTRLIWTR